jgi:hypothetical protein
VGIGFERALRILALEAAGPLPRFRGDLRHGISLTSWAFDVILSRVTGGSFLTLDLRLGLGDIDAKGPKVPFAQGQDFTFTAHMGSGVRYNFNARYAISAGLNYMHISNAGLSGKKNNYGINVYGPMFGIDVQLRRHPRHSER